MASKIVLAACALHNFIKSEEAAMPPSARLYCPPGYADQGDAANGTWRDEPPSGGLMDLQRTSIPAQERFAKKVREDFESYFNNEGAVQWQNSVINQ